MYMSMQLRLVTIQLRPDRLVVGRRHAGWGVLSKVAPTYFPPANLLDLEAMASLERAAPVRMHDLTRATCTINALIICDFSSRVCRLGEEDPETTQACVKLCFISPPPASGTKVRISRQISNVSLIFTLNC